MIFLKETCILNGNTVLSTKAIAPTTVVTAKDEREMSELHIICYLF